tara:strand:- start:110 stop:310 length:201 start_codon:yes stop_codon:yes gene_type:complete
MFLSRVIPRFPTEQWFRDSPGSLGFTLTGKDGTTYTSTSTLIEKDGTTYTFDLVLTAKDGTTYTTG